MNFIFHIGAHKTGSTALQKFLCSNQDALLKSGILYPMTGRVGNAHHDFPWAIRDRDVKKIAEMLAKIENEAKDLGVENVLLSSEEFEFVRNLHIFQHHVAKNNKIKAVVYFRRPDFYLESEYNQHIRMYKIRFKYDIYRFYLHVDLSLRFNYKNLIEFWKLFSQVEVVNYDFCATKGQGIFKEMINRLGIDWSNDFLLPDNDDSNISMPNIGTIYITRMNHLPLPEAKHHAAIEIISKKFAAQPKQRLLAYDDRLALWKRFEWVNSILVKDFDIEPFIAPGMDDDATVPPINYYEDFDKEIFEEIFMEITKKTNGYRKLISRIKL